MPTTPDLADQAARRRILNGSMLVGCDRHGAPAGAPCWVLPSDRPDRPDHFAVCGHRLAVARAAASRDGIAAAVARTQKAHDRQHAAIKRKHQSRWSS